MPFGTAGPSFGTAGPSFGTSKHINGQVILRPAGGLDTRPRFRPPGPRRATGETDPLTEASQEV